MNYRCYEEFFGFGQVIDEDENYYYCNFDSIILASPTVTLKKDIYTFSCDGRTGLIRFYKGE